MESILHFLTVIDCMWQDIHDEGGDKTNPRVQELMRDMKLYTKEFVKYRTNIKQDRSK